MSIKLLYAKMMNLRINEALWVLKIYDCADDDICFCNTWTTLRALDNTLQDNTRIVCSVSVSFWGGPPGHQSIYGGDLSMFITDRILRAWVEDKIDWLWLLNFHTGTTVHIANQLEFCTPCEKGKTIWG